ncbi:DNA primase [Patescibacteria group bacterium]|nr:DNA primase [Patescibacteria group bacterium]
MIFSPIDEIKNRLDIVEVIKGYIKLKKAGQNYRALCPFHSEKRPSFFVSPARQIWHCFGCNLGGDIFRFVMQVEGVEFGDALRILAQKAGVELKRQDPKLRTERQRLYEVYELSTLFFEKQLKGSKRGQEAKKYLIQRGINEESIKKWQVGYAPETWRGLTDFLVSKGYRPEEVEKAGLSIKSETENFYDRFRGRIIFPIFDLNSQVIGFGGRIFAEIKKTDKEVAKYINIPNTLLYDKSRILYGLDKAKMEIRKRDSCILVEGYTDVIMSSQAGFGNVVATSGTALTPYQLKILRRFTENLLTAFDMDVAGDSATKRGIDLAQSTGFNIKIVTMPEDLDPADIISKNPKDWEKEINQAKSILDFYFENTFSRFDKKTPQGKKEISRIILPVIKRIPNKIEQAHWVQQLAKALEVKEEDVAVELRKTKIEPQEIETEITSLPPKSRKELLEERFLILALKSPENLKKVFKEDFHFFSPKTSQIFAYFKKEIPEKKLDSESTDFLNYIYLKSEIEIEEGDSKEEFKNCLKEIKTLEIKNKLDKISREIKKAEEEKDLTKIQKLLEEFNLYSKSLRDLETSIQ